MHQANYKLSKESLILLYDAGRSAVINGSYTYTTYSTELEYCFKLYDAFSSNNGKVLWNILRYLPQSRFNIPDYVDVNTRWSTTFTGDNLIENINKFYTEFNKTIFKDDHIYKNGTILLMLRFQYALSHKDEFKDVLILK